MGQARTLVCPILFMRSIVYFMSASILTVTFLSVNIWGQAVACHPPSGSSSAQSSSLERAVSLAEIARSNEALPLLKIAAQKKSDKDALRQASVLGVRSAASLDQRGAVGEFLAILNREFPNDPEVLYI